ncbi:MAG TPA: YezD family protein [Nitrospirota bacterium]|jgi:hypothetical protein
MRVVEKETPNINENEARILRAVRGLRYGSVEITIHDSRVVQVERREKVRFEKKTEGGDGDGI